MFSVDGQGLRRSHCTARFSGCRRKIVVYSEKVKKCISCGMVGHITRARWLKPNLKKIYNKILKKEMRTCFIRGADWNISRDCKSKKQEGNSNATAMVSNSEIMSIPTNGQVLDQWILYLSCKRNMTYRREILITFVKENGTVQIDINGVIA